MTQEAHELLQRAFALPGTNVPNWLRNLISSLEATVDENVDAACQQKVMRRLDDVQQGKVGISSWEWVQQKGHTLLHGKLGASILS